MFFDLVCPLAKHILRWTVCQRQSGDWQPKQRPQNSTALRTDLKIAFKKKSGRGAGGALYIVLVRTVFRGKIQLPKKACCERVALSLCGLQWSKFAVIVSFFAYCGRQNVFCIIMLVHEGVRGKAYFRCSSGCMFFFFTCDTM